jgi:hypothetical protein
VEAELGSRKRDGMKKIVCKTKDLEVDIPLAYTATVGASSYGTYDEFLGILYRLFIVSSTTDQEIKRRSSSCLEAPSPCLRRIIGPVIEIQPYKSLS